MSHGVLFPIGGCYGNTLRRAPYGCLYPLKMLFAEKRVGEAEHAHCQESGGAYHLLHAYDCLLIVRTLPY